jgi:hypothetical protein
MIIIFSKWSPDAIYSIATPTNPAATATAPAPIPDDALGAAPVDDDVLADADLVTAREDADREDETAVVTGGVVTGDVATGDVATGDVVCAKNVPDDEPSAFPDSSDDPEPALIPVVVVAGADHDVDADAEITAVVTGATFAPP